VFSARVSTKGIISIDDVVSMIISDGFSEGGYLEI
jgi:hypothetical protein